LFARNYKMGVSAWVADDQKVHPRTRRKFMGACHLGQRELIAGRLRPVRHEHDRELVLGRERPKPVKQRADMSGTIASGEASIIAAVAHHVRMKRKAAGLSQEDLAHEAGVDRTYVSQVRPCPASGSVARCPSRTAQAGFVTLKGRQGSELAAPARQSPRAARPCR
jgi:hypothetical protein